MIKTLTYTLEDKAFNSRETLVIVLCDFSFLSGLHEYPEINLAVDLFRIEKENALHSFECQNSANLT